MISVKYYISEEIPEILEYVKTKHPEITTLILLVHLKGNFFLRNCFLRWKQNLIYNVEVNALSLVSGLCSEVDVLQEKRTNLYWLFALCRPFLHISPLNLHNPRRPVSSLLTDEGTEGQRSHTDSE